MLDIVVISGDDVCCSVVFAFSVMWSELLMASAISCPIGTHGGEVMYFGCVCFRGELGFLNCDYIGMCVMNKLFELLEFVFHSVYVDLQYYDMSLNFTAGYVSLCFICSHVVVIGLSMRLSWYPTWMR